MKYTNVSFGAIKAAIVDLATNGYLFGLTSVSDNATQGDGSETSFSWTNSIWAATQPSASRIKKGTVSVTDGTETFSDNSDGTLTGSAGGTGTVNYATGAISVTFNAAVANAQAITVSYSAGLAVAAVENAKVADGSVGGNKITLILADVDLTNGHVARLTVTMDGVPNQNQYGTPPSTSDVFIGGAN